MAGLSPADKTRRQRLAAKKAALTRKLCKALIGVNEAMDVFEDTKDAYFRLVYDEAQGDREAFIAIVLHIQDKLRSGGVSRARVNYNAAGAAELFKWIDRSTRR